MLMDLNQITAFTVTPNVKKELVFVEDIGVEPMTPCVQGRCSSQLS